MIKLNINRLTLVAIALTMSAGCSSSSPTEPSGLGTLGDFGGEYSGTYRVNDCVAAGSFADFCQEFSWAGSVLDMTLSLSQTPGAVSGPVTLGNVDGTFQGTASGSSLTGTAAMEELSDEGVIVITTIPTWNTTLSGSALSGGFTVLFRDVDSTGSATLTTTIVQLTR